MFTLTLRLPDDKHQRLKALARSKSISINKLMDGLATIALANYDARVRLELRSARGNPKRAGLARQAGSGWLIGGDMVNTTKMTSKGQATVPRKIRDRLGLKSGDKMAFTMLSDGTVVMRPKTRRFADLAGSLTRPGQPKVAVENMNPFKATASTRATKRRAR